MEKKADRKKKPTAIVIAVLMIIAVIAFIAIRLFDQNIPVTLNTADFKLYLDDSRYTIGSDNTVVLPDGRPRVPQLMCDDKDVEIYQAFFPDDEPVAYATARKGDVEKKIQFIRDASVGIEFQYDDRIQFASDIPNVTYTSSDPDVAMITLAGQIIITGVSDKGVTITATNGIETKELVITRTVRAPVGIYLLTGQSNAAYFFAEPDTASRTKKGAAYVYDISDGIYSIQSMNNEDGSQARGNIEAGIVKSLYDEMGEKVIIVNTGLSGEKIATFEPFDGASYAYTQWTWENLSYILATEWFTGHFEPRMRSYIWIQGESDDWLSPEQYMESYMKIHRTFRSDMYGFDYGFISQTVPRFFRPNDAQERLAQGYDDIFMATRVTNTFSAETGELRPDNLHYSQLGDNIAGESIGHTIAEVYKGNGYLLPEGTEH